MIIKKYVKFNLMPSGWNSTIKICLVDSSYVFTNNNTFAQISSHIIATNAIENPTKTQVSPSTYVFDADDAIFANPLKKTVGSILVYGSGSINIPYMLITELDGLPISSEFVIVNFSNGFNKIFSQTGSNTVFGNIIVGSYDAKQPVIPEETISRSNVNLPGELELDKNKLQSRTSIYKDVSITGKPHPLTGDVAVVSGIAAINQSLKIIMTSMLFERPYTSYDISANIHKYLFDINDSFTRKNIADEISIHIANHEPRINVLNIDIESILEKYQVKISVTYNIKIVNETSTFIIFLDRA